MAGFCCQAVAQVYLYSWKIEYSLPYSRATVSKLHRSQFKYQAKKCKVNLYSYNWKKTPIFILCEKLSSIATFLTLKSSPASD